MRRIEDAWAALLWPVIIFGAGFAFIMLLVLIIGVVTDGRYP